MIEIKDLLHRFEKILGRETVNIGLVQDVIKKFSKIEIPKDAVRLKGVLIILNIKPIFKNEVLLKKDLILTELRNLGLKVEDIR